MINFDPRTELATAFVHRCAMLVEKQRDPWNVPRLQKARSFAARAACTEDPREARRLLLRARETIISALASSGYGSEPANTMWLAVEMLTRARAR